MSRAEICALVALAGCSSIGLPGLNGFVGELLILQGVFVVSKLWAAVAATGMVLGAAYMLWLYQRTMFGSVQNVKNEKLLDLNLREVATFVPLLIMAVWIGLYPKPFIDLLDTSVNRVIARVSPQYLEGAALTSVAKPAPPGAASPVATTAAAADAAAAAQPADCPENVPTSKFTTAPCDPAEAAGAPAAAGKAPEAVAAPPAAGRPKAMGGQ